MTGQFAISRAGHDKGVLYVVVAEQGDFVYLSDGRLKPPEKPKKKRRKHIQPVSGVADEGLRARLLAGEPVRSEEIRCVIRSYESLKQTKTVEEMYVKE